eukprot:5791544-Alexandrium_andersonii.AAC.1
MCIRDSWKSSREPRGALTKSGELRRAPGSVRRALGEPSESLRRATESLQRSPEESPKSFWRASG